MLVSLGTVNAEVGDRFFATAVEALAGPGRPPGRWSWRRPTAVAAAADADNILVLERVPQLALLPHLDAVVSHGGHNTVCEALAHGLPLVLAPIRDDQPIVADQVVAAGAGAAGAVRPGRATELRAAVDDRARPTPTCRAAARGIARSFHEAGGAAAAADAVEALVDVEVPRHDTSCPPAPVAGGPGRCSPSALVLNGLRLRTRLRPCRPSTRSPDATPADDCVLGRSAWSRSTA